MYVMRGIIKRTSQRSGPESDNEILTALWGLVESRCSIYAQGGKMKGMYLDCALKPTLIQRQKDEGLQKDSANATLTKLCILGNKPQHSTEI